jgi:tRNA pseudouridine38-40 synthase
MTSLETANACRMALGIEYSGENYCGWQKQKHSPSVQQPLEQILSQIAAQPINVFCAGRTDTGVNATGQVVHFDMQGTRPYTAWLRGANSQLPKDISIVWAKQVDSAFHARFSALSRTYRYIIQNSEAPTATLNGKVTWHRRPLNHDLMQQGANHLVGKHDFSSFRASSCQANTAVRTIESINISRMNQLIFIDIKANAFLHHMVRNIVGCLLLVAEGRRPPHFVKDLLAKKDRQQAPDTSKPGGLYLVDAGYPDEFQLPKSQMTPLGFPMQLD